MKHPRIKSPSDGYFYAKPAKDAGAAAWAIHRSKNDKQIGTFFAGFSYVPYRSVALTVWELQELTQLLNLVTVHKPERYDRQTNTGSL